MTTDAPPPVRLTQYSHGGGCGCKLGPADLRAVVSRLPRAAHPDLTWQRFLTHNLLPVTFGNLIGGAVLVGLVYWFVYLRAQPAANGADDDARR